MANDTKKSKGNARSAIKITFGDKKKGKGKGKKSYGPKQEKPKRYRGQGRRH